MWKQIKGSPVALIGVIVAAIQAIAELVKLARKEK